MNVSLTPELEAFIASKVESGFYHSSSEVIREGLRLLAEKDMIRQQRIAEFNRELQIGWDEMEAGNLLDGETVMRELMQEFNVEKK